MSFKYSTTFAIRLTLIGEDPVPLIFLYTRQGMSLKEDELVIDIDLFQEIAGFILEEKTPILCGDEYMIDIVSSDPECYEISLMEGQYFKYHDQIGPVILSKTEVKILCQACENMSELSRYTKQESNPEVRGVRRTFDFAEAMVVCNTAHLEPFKEKRKTT